MFGLIENPHVDNVHHPLMDIKSIHNPLMDKPRKILADNLTRLMRQSTRHRTNQQLSDATGLGIATISRIRNAEVAASLDTVATLADAFKLPPHALLLEELSATTVQEAAHTYQITEKPDNALQDCLTAITDAYVSKSLNADSLAALALLARSMRPTPQPVNEHAAGSNLASAMQAKNSIKKTDEPDRD